MEIGIKCTSIYHVRRIEFRVIEKVLLAKTVFGCTKTYPKL